MIRKNVENSAQSDASRVLHVGGIGYLNARPLLYGLDGEGEPPMRVTHHSPRELAARLAGGTLDVALVPVVAYPEASGYRIVPEVGISSYGAVRSIRLYHRTAVRDARRIALDACSRTSVLLTRLLYRDLWRAEPAFEVVEPSRLADLLRSDPPEDTRFDAALLIGDAALACDDYPGWEACDLGTEWTRWTGLPFVYAFWVCREGLESSSEAADIAARLQRARETGTARVDDIVRSVVEEKRLPPGMQPSECLHYLSQVIHYDLGPDKLEALTEFYARLRSARLVDWEAPKLRMLEAARSRRVLPTTLTTRASPPSGSTPPTT